MNAGMAHSLDSLFGPASDAIDIAAFLQPCQDIGASSEPESSCSVSGTNGWSQLLAVEKSEMEKECSVDDIRQSVFDLWDDPTMSAYIQKDHNYTISILHSSTKPSRQSSRKHLPDPETLPTEVIELQRSLKLARLESLKLQMDAAIFTRSCMNSDYNALSRVHTSNNSEISKSNLAVITFTVYNRLSWGPSYLSRSSQHCILSCQTLHDLISVIPCSSAISAEPRQNTGCAVCIEGLLYGNDAGEALYADKVLEHMSKISKKSLHVNKAPTSLMNTPISSLNVRINEPYWMLHFGNCEHFLVLDQIRLASTEDPPSGYPLTIQLTPILLDLCRACGRVPALYSVVRDVRLGESPCLLCGPCWRTMGHPEGSDILVLPLSNPY